MILNTPPLRNHSLLASARYWEMNVVSEDDVPDHPE